MALPLSRWSAGLTAVAVAVTLAACGGGDKGAAKAPSQTAVKVNGGEITVHQINYALQQAGPQRPLKPEQMQAASQQALERLIDQELAVQKGKELKLDQDPTVLQQLEAARRDILARAYLQRVAQAVPKPTEAEVAKYFEQNPNLFTARKIYQIQELSVTANPEDVKDLEGRVAGARSMAELAEYLRTQNIRFTANQGIRAAEQLPLARLGTYAAMRDGEIRIDRTPQGAHIMSVVMSKPQPVTLETARGMIELFLQNDARRKLVVEDLKKMRDAAKIEYVGSFARPASGAEASLNDVAPQAVPASAPMVPPVDMTAPAPAAAASR